MVHRRLKLVLSVFSALLVVFFYAVAFAADGNAGGDNAFTARAYMGLAAGLGIGIAAFGGALGQARAAAAALEGIARNPDASGKIFTPMVLALALIETLVLYALLITYFLQDKIKF